MALHAYRDRPLSDSEREILRLALSSFRDGSGQTYRGGRSWPGFRDYERSLAAVLGGVTPENKGVFDVAVATTNGLPFGISCKMAVFPPPGNQCSFMEMSNSAAKFRDHLLRLQITYANEPMLAVAILPNLGRPVEVLPAAELGRLGDPEVHTGAAALVSPLEKARRYFGRLWPTRA